MSSTSRPTSGRKISRLTLHAAATHGTALELTASHPDVQADAARRELSGTLIPYGEWGHTSIGLVMVPAPGRIKMLDADLTRIKLVDEHQKPPRPIGYMTAMRDTPEGLRAAHYVAETMDGERAWQDYNRVGPDGGRARDAFSVELVDVYLTDTGELIEATLKAVAFVTTPAWANSRPDGLAASLITPEGTTHMTPEQIARLAELRAMNTRTPEDEQEFQDLVQLGLDDLLTEEAAEPAAAPAAAASAPAANASRAPATTRPRQHAAAPAGVGPVPERTAAAMEAGAELSAAYDAMARVFRGESRVQLEAALANITNTANIWTAQPEFGGQLWSGNTYQRRWVDLMTSGTLTSYKGTAWRWGVKPAVGDYTGDKAAVPSNSPTTVEVPWTASRLAGAHDIDRKYYDFGDREFIEAYYAAMTESYARQSDAKAEAFIQANRGTPVVAGAGIFRAMATAAANLETAVGNGTVPDYINVNPADKLALIGMTNQQLPAYLEMFGITMDKVRSSTLVPALSVTVGVKAATTFKELPGSPIRAEAIDMVNGGVDGGVFGYYATLLNYAGGIQSATFT